MTTMRAIHSLPFVLANLQGFVLDAGAVDGFSATAGLEMWVQ